MLSVPVYNLEGKVIKEISLEDRLFSVEANPAVIKQVVVAQQANSRQVLAHTKTRGEVRGGGKKPWKQKGTGRARHGSSRSPIWVGGGVTFGPRNNRNFSLLVNKKMKRKALAMVLSQKASNNQLIVVDSLNLSEIKTKVLAATLLALPMKKIKTIIALDKNNENVVKSAKNLPKVMTLPAAALNVVDLMSYQYLLIEESALPTLYKNYSVNVKSVK
jgi:large subunit ribosomal protein L4